VKLSVPVSEWAGDSARELGEVRVKVLVAEPAVGPVAVPVADSGRLPVPAAAAVSSHNRRLSACP